MPRASRYSLSGNIWHITHRCHKKDFLLKFAKDRQCLRHWIFEAKKRYGLSVLNYVITSNHIHLLVADQGSDEIPKSMQLIAGRTAQEYNIRKQRKGAFWEDRYHATAIDTGEYLAQCMIYIDLNMLRAGVVTRPEAWSWCGYSEIQTPPERYRIIDVNMLLSLFEMNTFSEFQYAHEKWLNSKLADCHLVREAYWTQSLAVGSESYVKKIKADLGISTRYRTVTNTGETYKLEESAMSYKI
jgi:putative transposase